MNESVKESVQDYYGNVLQSSDDLKTSACCPLEGMPAHLQPLLKNIHEDIQQKFYGCGSPIPSVLEGAKVLDLGCGTGRDAYLLSQLVGEKGHVYGVDMTDEQLAVAKQYQDYHQEKFGFQESNVTFLKGHIEDLKSLGIEDNSLDVVVSNCVINLSANKEQVFKEIFRVLKPGGELYFSDIFADRRIPKNLQTDPVLLGECLGGAMYLEDFRRALADLNCLDYRVVSNTDLTIEDEEIRQKLAGIHFYSMTVRTFKADFEDRCEDFGHEATYQGTMSEFPDGFTLDDHHYFPKGESVRICGNTTMMLADTRYASHFKITGDFTTHFGLFDCSTDAPEQKTAGACC